MAETIVNLKGNVVEADLFRGSVEGTVSSPAIEALTPLTGSPGGAANDVVQTVPTLALSTGDTYTDAAVNTAVDAILEVVRNDLNDLQTKVNAIISALQA